jgi:hypothetical protein
MTQEQFEIFKAARIEKLKAVNACQTQLDRAIAANTPEDYLKIIIENINWLGQYKAITSDELLQFGDELLLSNGIYVRKSVVAEPGKIYFSSTVKAYGSSTVEAYGSSTVKAYDSSTVKAYDSSTVKAYDSSTVKAYDSSNCLKGKGTVEIKSDNAFMRELGTNKIYVRKGKFEIIEI